MEERPNYLAVIPADVRYDNTLKDKAKLLYGEIVALSNKEGYCWASNNYFAKLYSINKNTVSRLIQDLAEKGYIKIKIIYKENTKEIENRYIQIGIYPYPQNGIYPIYQNVKENNTSINNTSINNYIYSRVIDYLNEKIGTSYKNTTKSTRQHIKARLDEGFTEDDFIKVIDKKVKEWKNTKFEKFLRPDTLFSTKFESYLNQKGKGWEDDYWNE